MKKKLIKVFTFLIIVGLLGVLVRYAPQVFAGKQQTPDIIDLSSIINTGCIEFTTPDGTVQKCDDVEIYYAEEVYPVKKWQKTGGMSDFTDQEINVEIGEYILYKVDFVNLGEKSFVGTVKDYLPNCITFITGSVHGDGISNAVFDHNSSYTQVRFRGISLLPGQSGYMLVTGQVSNSENCQNVTRYTNTGSFKSTNPSGTELFDSVVAKRSDQGNPKLNIDKKILTEQYLEEGETVAYKITVKNIGSGTATGVQIYDELPIEIQYQTSTIDLPSYSTYYFDTNSTGNTIYISYTGITLEPEGKAVVYLTGKVKAGYTFNSGVENCAMASGYDMPEVIICVTPDLPEVHMEKELLTTGNLVPGDTVVYRIKVWNSGGAAEPSLEIYDELPVQIQYQTSSISINPNSAYYFDTNTTGQTVYVRYTGINLEANGKATVYLTGKVKAGHIFDENAENCATVSGENTPEIEDCVIPGPTPDVHVEKELLTTGNLTSGATVVYRINAWNSGGAAALGLEIYDELPNVMQYLTSSIAVNPHSSTYFKTGLTGNTTYILYTGINLGANGGRATIYLTGKVKPGYAFDENTENCAIVSGENIPETGDCVTPGPKPEVHLEKELLTTGYLGSGATVVYRIKAWNSGGMAAPNLEIYDELPEIMQYQTSSIVMSPHSSTYFKTGLTGNTTYILYTGINLAANGGRATIYLTGKVKPGYEFDENTENCATISGESIPETGDCVSPTPPPPITSGDIVITKSVNKYYVQQGDTVIYTIKYHNKSDRPLYDYKIIDNRPSELIFNGATPQETSSGANTITWLSPEYPLYPHSTGTITITGTVR